MPVRFVVFLTIAGYFSISAQAQQTVDADSTQSAIQTTDSILIGNLFSSDDTLQLADTLLADSLRADSIQQPTRRKSALDSEVQYTADDSIMVSLTGEKLYLFGNAHVVYTNIDLKASYIEIDYSKEEIFARGVADTLGNVTGQPVFTQGKQSFESDSMRYNFNTEKGIIYHIITEQGEGYLHSDKTKRHAEGHIHIRDGKYTTCDARHPHFYLALKKGIVIPEDKIITGHAYIVMADVPIQVLGVPFGFFPNTTSRASGILIPTYGSEERRGFYLRNFGWYQVLGDYADLRMYGDYYTKGSWAMRSTLSYRWRYHFSGNLSFKFAHNEIDDQLDYEISKDWGVSWSHRQDPKANPTRTFSASVNFTSRDYDQNHSTSSQARLTNNKTSSISYTKRWPGTPFNFSMSGNANQNSKTNITRLSLPTGSFNMSTIYPLRGLGGGARYKWYENISLSYSAQFQNSVEDSTNLILEPETWEPENLQNGLSHNIPLSVNLKLGKMITVSPSVSYRGMLYTKKVLKDVEVDTITGRTEEVITDIVPGFYSLYSLTPSIGASFTPKLFGMYQSTKTDGYFEAMRHVITPGISASYTPDVTNEKLQPVFKPDYYEPLTFIDTAGNLDTLRMYSPWEDEVYRVPSSPGKSASIRFSLNNNLEMKVRPRNDTTGESKKVSVLDNLNFSTSYSPFAEEFKWGPVTMVTGTRLFNNKVNVRANGRWDLYGLDEEGARVNEFFYETDGKLLRFTSMNISTGFSLRSKAGDKSKGKEEDPDDLLTTTEEIRQSEFLDDDMNMTLDQYADAYVNFSIPWSLNFDYSWSVNKASVKTTYQQTLRVRGDFSVTPKWKIGGQTGYDLEAREFTYTTINIYRDLHCWEMRFTIIPIGRYSSYSFTIQAKGSLLRDLKYEREPNWYDQF